MVLIAQYGKVLRLPLRSYHLSNWISQFQFDINNTTITTANGCKLKVLGKGDVQIKLMNSAKCTKTILKEAYMPQIWHLHSSL